MALDKGSFKKQPPSSPEQTSHLPQPETLVYLMHSGRQKGSLWGRLYKVPSGSRSSGSGCGRGRFLFAQSHWVHTAEKRTRSTYEGRRRSSMPATSSGMSDHDVVECGGASAICQSRSPGGLDLRQLDLILQLWPPQRPPPILKKG